MSTKLRRIDFYPDDRLSGTMGLSPEEPGVHVTIVSLIYASGDRLRDDER